MKKREKEKNSDPHFNLERAQKHTGIDRKGLGEGGGKGKRKKTKIERV